MTLTHLKILKEKINAKNAFGTMVKNHGLNRVFKNLRQNFSRYIKSTRSAADNCFSKRLISFLFAQDAAMQQYTHSTLSNPYLSRTSKTSSIVVHCAISETQHIKIILFVILIYLLILTINLTTSWNVIFSLKILVLRKTHKKVTRRRF